MYKLVIIMYVCSILTILDWLKNKLQTVNSSADSLLYSFHVQTMDTVTI